MLTPNEAMKLKKVVIEAVGDSATRDWLLKAIERATDNHYPKNDVIAAGPNLSSATMLNDAARALGWRTDFACGDSPITWELVLDEIVKLSRGKPPSAVVACVGDKYKFEYEHKEYNCELTVVRVTGYRKNDFVFFDDGSHSKQEKMMAMKKVE